MTTCSNKKEKPIKRSKQAIEIILDLISQEKKTNPVFKNIDLNFIKESLNRKYKGHYPISENQNEFRDFVIVILNEQEMNGFSNSKLVQNLGCLFSEFTRLEKIAKVMSDYYKILSVFMALFAIVSTILTLAKMYLTASPQQNPSLFLETNKASKHIFRGRK